MTSLAQFQAALADGLWRGLSGDLLAEIAPGPVAADLALETHRDTIFSILNNCLRLSYPTVDWLVGKAFFDQAARAYALTHPPSRALLSGYGEAFADFMRAYAPAASLAYLPDVARFDWAVEQAAACSLDRLGRPIDLGAGAALQLDASLRLLRLTYRADRLCDARAGDGAGLAQLDLSLGDHAYALWRGADGILARLLSPASAAFLEALLEGQTAEAALDALLAEAGEAGLGPLQAEIFTAPFARIQASPP